jgi:uroporphyrinogen-III decarboxylase
MSILGKSPAEVMDEARSAVAEAGAAGFILAPGCAVPTDTPEENLFAMRQVVEP